jgi:hypothetical protein
VVEKYGPAFKSSTVKTEQIVPLIRRSPVKSQPTASAEEGPMNPKMTFNVSSEVMKRLNKNAEAYVLQVTNVNPNTVTTKVI